ncbi:MAG: helix-turn-helix domain-containing protein, partial [Acutalibacteraceae bacterium]
VNNENKAYSVFLNRPLGFSNICNIQGLEDDFIQLFERIIKEKNSDGKLSEEMQELLINQLLIMIYRLNSKIFTSFDREKFDIVFSLQKKFEENCRERYTLEDLAKEYHISVSSLSHQFKIITGFSVFEYLYSCRIATAKYYLSKTNLSIGEITELSGFCDNSNFSRTFKRVVGMTPSQFREKYRLK